MTRIPAGPAGRGVSALRELMTALEARRRRVVLQLDARVAARTGGRG